MPETTACAILTSIMYLSTFERLIADLQSACQAVYGPRLRALAIFGSVARGTPRPDSDIDLLLVADPLPQGRRARLLEFEAVDQRLDESLRLARRQGVHTCVSPILKTPEELVQGSLLYLDMIEDARILIDVDGILRRHLDALASRLRTMGARKISKGGGYYWELKPDYRWGEHIRL